VAPGRREPLTRERIVAAALALVERGGLAAFSLRGLAAALGCEPMSLYHHFPSKAHLQDAMVDAVVGEFVADLPTGDPLARLRAMMHAYRALAHRRPRLFQLLATHRLNTPVGVRVIDEAIRAVRGVIPDDRLAAQWFRALSYYVTGAALDETAGYAKGPSAAEPVSDAYVAEHCPNLAAAAPYFKPPWWDGTFELGLESLLDALRAAAAPPSPVAFAPKPVIHPKR
jgi:AcrR family transcriptional regulator